MQYNHGALDGRVPNAACRFKKMAMSYMSLSLIFPNDALSNLIKGYVPCHFMFTPMPHFTIGPMSNLRNAVVALLILGVTGHILCRP